MRVKNIPENALAATMALLAPYCPELSPTGLIQALRDHNATPTPKSNRLLTKHEAAELLGLSWFRLIELARAGKIPAVKMNNTRWRFKEADLLAWAADETEEGGAEDD